MSAEIEVIYRADRPSGGHGVIEVYGDPAMGWYEWRIKDRGSLILDTALRGGFGMQYGSASIALRDALNEDEPPPAIHCAELEKLAASLAFLEKYCLETISELQQRGLHGPCNQLIYIAACLKEGRRRLSEAMAYGKGVEQ